MLVRREALLRGVTATAALVGCLGDGGPGDGADGTPTRTNEEDWPPPENVTPTDAEVAVAEDGRAYVGRETVRALDESGEVLWSATPEGGAVQSLVVDDGVYAVTRNAGSHIADGAVDSSVVASGVRSLVVDEGVYAATGDAMYELAL